jgi:hypothetical protein
MVTDLTAMRDPYSYGCVTLEGCSKRLDSEDFVSKRRPRHDMNKVLAFKNTHNLHVGKNEHVPSKIITACIAQNYF